MLPPLPNIQIWGTRTYSGADFAQRRPRAIILVMSDKRITIFGKDS